MSRYYLEESEPPRPGTGTAFVGPVTTWIVSWQDDEGRVRTSEELSSEGMATGWAIEQGAAKIIINREDNAPAVVYTRAEAEAALAHEDGR